jgi:hypothetical protein
LALEGKFRMAKQTVGPLVLHLEKGVLGLAALLLLGAVALYGVMSPNKIGDEALGPGDVDKEIRTAADNLKEKLVNSEPQVTPPPNPKPMLLEGEVPRVLAHVPAQIPAPVPFNPQVSKFLGTEGVGARVELAEIIAPAAPTLTLGRSGLTIVTPGSFEQASGGEAGTSADSNWITVTTLFDRAKQQELFQRSNYDQAGMDVQFLGLDVERRMLKPDGAWDEWVAIDPVSRRTRPEYPAVQLEERNNKLDVVPEQRSKVEDFVALITKPDNQLELMRPPFPAVGYGDGWKYPRVAEHDVLQMDAEYQTEPNCRYPECSGDKAAATSVDGTASFKELMDKAEAELRSNDPAKAQLYADAAEKKADLNESEKKKVASLQDRVKKAIEEKRKTIKTVVPVQMLWVHDAAPDSVLSGRTYQYRCRVRVYNRYAAMPAPLTNQRDAEKIELTSAWSEPSEPVTVPLDTVVFIKSARQDRRECKVDVFKWVAGEWLRRTFDVKVGDRIGSEQRVDTPKGQRQPVNFDAGGAVVDIDFKRPFRPATQKGGGKADKDTTALVYVDDAGELHERLLDLDKASAEYKDKSSKVWKESKD